MPVAQLPAPDSPALYFETRGDGAPVVLLNGLSQSTANWRSHARRLGEHFQVVCYDARGQGRSLLGAERLSLALHVSDLLQLLDHLKIRRVSLCGFSHGARIAARFAATYPDRVRALILTSIGDNSEGSRKVIVRSWREVLERGGLEAMAYSVLPTIMGRRFLDENERHLDAMIRASLDRNSEKALLALIRALAEYPSVLKDAPKISASTLLITSREDLLVSEGAASRLAESLPSVRHEKLSGIGHTIPIEAPDRWRDLVRTFLLSQ